MSYSKRDRDTLKDALGITVPQDAPFFRTPYNYNRDAASNLHGLECLDKTLAQQQFKDECDINILFARYLETGEMPQIQQGLTYGNFEGIFDFQTAMNAVRTAEGLFTQLPARVKNRFDNDPQKLLEFMADPENRAEAEFLGLIDKKGPIDETRSEGLPGSGTKTATQSSGTPASKGAPATDEKPGPKTPKDD